MISSLAKESAAFPRYLDVLHFGLELTRWLDTSMTDALQVQREYMDRRRRLDGSLYGNSLSIIGLHLYANGRVEVSWRAAQQKLQFTRRSVHVLLTTVVIKFGM